MHDRIAKSELHANQMFAQQREQSGAQESNLERNLYAQAEEVGRLEQSIPLGLAVNNLLTYLHTRLKLPLHHLQGGVGHVEGGVLLGVGGRDDRHHVEPVRHVVARVPHREPQPEILGFLKIKYCSDYPQMSSIGLP